MMDSTIFNLTVDRLEQYSNIFHNLTQNGDATVNEIAYRQLEQMISDLIQHLSTNAKGQV